MDATGLEQYPVFDTVKSSPNCLLYTLLPPVDYKSNGKALRETQIVFLHCCSAIEQHHFLIPIQGEAFITFNLFVEKLIINLTIYNKSAMPKMGIKLYFTDSNIWLLF